MQQHSGFENRFIDVCLCEYGNQSEQTVESSFYAHVFNPIDEALITFFPGVKTEPFALSHSEEKMLSAANILLPTALLFTALLFVFLKNVLKSSISGVFLVGISPKSLQENERRQIERNVLIINAINIVSFFSTALILYAFLIRFNFITLAYELLTVSEGVFYLALFLSITAAVFCFFYSRSGLIALFGSIFSVPKVMKEYQKPYKLFFVSMAPVLLLYAIFLAFAPFFLMSSLLYFLLFIAICYVIFVVVSLFKFANLTNRFSIHIFLYLCTLEILPLFVIIKVLQSGSF